MNMNIKFLVIIFLAFFSSCSKEMQPAKNSFEVVKFWNVLISSGDQDVKLLSSTEKTEVTDKNSQFYPMFVCENSADFLVLESLQKATYTIYKNNNNEWEQVDQIKFESENIIEITDQNSNDDFSTNPNWLFFNKGLAGFSTLELDEEIQIAEKDYHLRENCKVWLVINNQNFTYQSNEIYKEEFTYTRLDGKKVVAYFIVKH